MRRTLTITLTLLAVAVSSCDKNEEGLMPKTNDKQPITINENENEMNKLNNLEEDGDHEKIIAEMQKQLNEVDEKIQALKRRLQTTKGKLKDRLELGLHAVEKDRQEVEKVFETFKTETTEQWQTAKEKTQAAIAHLKERVEKINQDNE